MAEWTTLWPVAGHRIPLQGSTVLSHPWESVPEASKDAAGMWPGGAVGHSWCQRCFDICEFKPQSLCVLTLHVSRHVEGLRGTLGLRTRVLQGILRTVACRSVNSGDWLWQPLLLYKGHQTPLNTKYSFICQWRLHGITSGFVFLPFFFFLEGIYICIYLQPCRYLHSQGYSVRNTKVLRKKTSQN